MSIPRKATTTLAVLASTLMSATPPNLTAQDLDPVTVAERLRTGLREADITGDNDALARMVTLARRAVTALPDDAIINHYMGFALYRLAGPIMDTDVEGAIVIAREAQSFLERSIEIAPIPESHALLSSVLGMQIVSDAEAMTLGMLSDSELAKARRLGPDNPRVRLLEGIAAFHKPEMWGGGHEAALVHFLAAIELFADDDPETPLPAWGHAEAYTWLGRTYDAMGKADEARAAYERALEVEPGYAAVRGQVRRSAQMHRRSNAGGS
ncbi:MAG: tetratricopeptide repeat protein [Gemmatimonadetes bacterium]|nr:tetratricopeptide repeat protein [Gemmatimonadota bacterium]MYB97722.1 tetratricopeptide repeat protein [Gemmatimonadota bacterium]MYI44880.1 tetratricopeptide repeat protein [Gemmatimonadota bacterium]